MVEEWLLVITFWECKKKKSNYESIRKRINHTERILWNSKRGESMDFYAYTQIVCSLRALGNGEMKSRGSTFALHGNHKKS